MDALLKATVQPVQTKKDFHIYYEHSIPSKLIKFLKLGSFSVHFVCVALAMS